MPIYEIDDNPRIPLLGKIKLGDRADPSNRSDYPKNKPYFVLKGAPKVAKVYGDQPEALDIMFPSDDIDEVAPAFFRWYAKGQKDGQGNLLGGPIQCKGCGPRKQKDGEGNERIVATKAEFYRDQQEGQPVPLRDCHGRNCEDFKARRCKMSMNLLVWIPRAADGFEGVYQIDTTSIHSIAQIRGYLLTRLSMVRNRAIMLGNDPKEAVKGVLVGRGFKLIKKETLVNKKKGYKQPIIKIETNQALLKEHKDQIISNYNEATIGSTVFKMLPDVSVSPMEDNYALEGGVPTEALPPGDMETIDVNQGPTEDMLLKDPQVMAAFADLEQATKKNISEKWRRAGIKQEQGAQNWKAAILSRLSKRLEEVRTPPQQQQQQQQPQQQQPQQKTMRERPTAPVQEAMEVEDGLI